jgi:SpoVK/Ycf46/Vps4 family AAA+-type ATPase
LATANQILALVKSHVSGDEEQLLSIALQIAAAEARRGRDTKAKELRDLVEQARKQRNSATHMRATTSIATPRGDLSGLISVSHPKTRLPDMILPDNVHDRLASLLHQQRQRDRLRQHGQRPNARLLLIGPPGSGKTMTAAAVSGELHLPLMTIRLDSLITKFLGETASKMRLIFDQIANHRAVYLFDEFDALGARRGLENDVGEMRRVLNSFLQFVEEPNSTDSVVIATTNHPQILDHALLRRFDDVIEYALPSANDAQRLLKEYLRPVRTKIRGWKRIQNAAAGLSQGELARAAAEVVKHTILEDAEPIGTAALIQALENRHSMRQRIDAAGK